MDISALNKILHFNGNVFSGIQNRYKWFILWTLIMNLNYESSFSDIKIIDKGVNKVVKKRGLISLLTLAFHPLRWLS